jgi:hypothetical protein
MLAYEIDTKPNTFLNELSATRLDKPTGYISTRAVGNETKRKAAFIGSVTLILA